METVDKELARVGFDYQEDARRHHTYDEELLQYELMKKGDLEAALPQARKLFRGNLTGKLSDDAVRNFRYLFVASITLCCRFCIEGGMSQEDAYNLSDIYIQTVDKCETVDEIFALHEKMFTDYTRRMGELKEARVYSKQVLLCLDYIDQHLHEAITVGKLAVFVRLSPSYLSALFRRETGTPVSEYVRRKKIDAAKTLLQYSQYSCADIAGYLAFSSHSHFTKLFRQYEGMTPREYQLQNFRRHWQ